MSRSERLRGLVLVCGFAVAVSTNYTNPGPVLSLIAAEFGLDSAHAGAIATALFFGSALTMIQGGLLADRVGARRIVTVGFLVTAVCNIATGLLAPTYPLLLAWRVVGGLGTGLAFAAGAAYTRSLFDDRGAHLAQGMYGASFLVGSASTLIYMPLLSEASGGWRGAFAASGAVIAALWLLWVLLAPAGPAGRAGRFGTAGGAGGGQRIGDAVRERNTWLLGLCHTCGFGLVMVVGTWVTTYLAHGFSLPLTTAGPLGSILLVTAMAARLGGGAILERGVAPVRLIQMALGLVALGLLIMSIPAGALGVAVIGILLTGLGAGLPYAAVFNGAAASVPNSPASSQALVGWGGVLVAVVGPPIVGGLLDITGSFGAGFAALAGFALLVLVSTIFLRPFSFAGPELAA